MKNINLTTKQEKFSQLWFSLGNKSEAYRQAYDARNMADETIWVQACEVSKNHKVAVRYAELVDEARERNDTTVDTLDQMAKDAYALAKAENKPSAMNQAVSVLAKLHGLNSPEKTRVDGYVNHGLSIKQLLDEIDGSNTGLPAGSKYSNTE